VEVGRIIVGDGGATEKYKEKLRNSIELLDQIIKLLGKDELSPK
jgi:hypothetical protein